MVVPEDDFSRKSPPNLLQTLSPLDLLHHSCLRRLAPAASPPSSGSPWLSSATIATRKASLPSTAKRPSLLGSDPFGMWLMLPLTSAECSGSSMPSCSPSCLLVVSALCASRRPSRSPPQATDHHPFADFLKNLDQTNVNSAFVSGMKEDLGMYGNELTTAITCWTVGYVVGQSEPSCFIAEAFADSELISTSLLLPGALSLSIASRYLLFPFYTCPPSPLQPPPHSHQSSVVDPLPRARLGNLHAGKLQGSVARWLVHCAFLCRPV